MAVEDLAGAMVAQRAPGIRGKLLGAVRDDQALRGNVAGGPSYHRTAEAECRAARIARDCISKVAE